MPVSNFRSQVSQKKIKGQVIPSTFVWLRQGFCNKHLASSHVPSEKTLQHSCSRNWYQSRQYGGLITLGAFASPRAWWMLAMGHSQRSHLRWRFQRIKTGCDRDWLSDSKTGQFEGQIQDNYFVNAQQIKTTPMTEVQTFWMHVLARSISKFLNHVKACATDIFDSICLPFAQVLNAR